jgi:hypothetical protein
VSGADKSGVDDSLIARSGQLVPFRTALISIVIGTLIMMVAPRVHDTIPIYVAYPLGVVLAIGGAVFLARWIRCPQCGERVLWEALRQHPAELHEALYRESCDRCGHNPGAD